MNIVIWCFAVWFALNAFVVFLRWMMTRQRGCEEPNLDGIEPPMPALSGTGETEALRFPSQLKVGAGFVSVSSGFPPLGHRGPRVDQRDSDEVQVRRSAGAGD